MDPIHIDFTIPDQSLFIGFGLLVFAIVLYLAISKNWEWLQNRPNPLPWMAEHYVALLLPLGFIAISLAIYFWIWDIRGEIGRLVTLLSSKTTPEDIRNLAYAIAALLGAVALSATIPFQLIKVWVNERLAKTTEQGHMTDRITKAVEQLGAEKTVKAHRRNKKGVELYEDDLNGDPDYKKPIITETTEPNLEVRLGAIYALERIAQDSERDHIPVMEILCAYIRLNSPKTEGYIPTPFKSSVNAYQRSPPMPLHIQHEDIKRKQEHDKEIRTEIDELALPRIDIQAALSAIGRRNYSNPKQHSYIEFVPDLTNCNLQKSKLFNNFDGTNSTGSLLDGAILAGNFHNCITLRISKRRWNISKAKPYLT